MVGDVLLVGDHDDRLAGVVQLAQHFHDLLAGGRVEVAGRLVGQDDVGIVDQRPGDGHALLLAAGELGGPVVDPIAQADQPGELDRPLVRLLAELAGSLVGQRELDVLEHGVLRDQVVRLEDEAEVAAADLGELVVVEPRDVATAQEVLAAGRAVEAAQQVEHGALARAGGAHDGDVFAGVDIDGHAPQGVHRDRRDGPAAAQQTAAALGVAHHVRLRDVDQADDRPARGETVIRAEIHD